MPPPSNAPMTYPSYTSPQNLSNAASPPQGYSPPIENQYHKSPNSYMGSPQPQNFTMSPPSPYYPTSSSPQQAYAFSSQSQLYACSPQKPTNPPPLQAYPQATPHSPLSLYQGHGSSPNLQNCAGSPTSQVYGVPQQYGANPQQGYPTSYPNKFQALSKHQSCPAGQGPFLGFVPATTPLVAESSAKAHSPIHPSISPHLSPPQYFPGLRSETNGQSHAVNMPIGPLHTIPRIKDSRPYYLDPCRPNTDSQTTLVDESGAAWYSKIAKAVGVRLC
jgi:hypothetical protein